MFSAFHADAFCGGFLTSVKSWLAMMLKTCFGRIVEESVVESLQQHRIAVVVKNCFCPCVNVPTFSIRVGRCSKSSCDGRSNSTKPLRTCWTQTISKAVAGPQDGRADQHSITVSIAHDKVQVLPQEIQGGTNVIERVVQMK